MLFEKIAVWRDSKARSGHENMAIDQWLFENMKGVPVLRLYEWEGDWVSFGYFQSHGGARELFGDECRYVRRQTGGGVVDHRGDQTYTLVIPREEEVARLSGCERYSKIHGALADCLGEGGVSCDLARGESAVESVACFKKAVRWDLLGMGGVKLAGAGQRRSRAGLLHQGSVVCPKGGILNLARYFGEECIDLELGDMRGLRDLEMKYSSSEWMERVG